MMPAWLLVPWYWVSGVCCSPQGCTASEWAAQMAGQSEQRSCQSPVSETVETHQRLTHHQWASPEIRHKEELLGNKEPSKCTTTGWSFMSCFVMRQRHVHLWWPYAFSLPKRLTFPEWSGLMAMPNSVWMKVWLIRWVTSLNVFP